MLSKTFKNTWVVQYRVIQNEGPILQDHKKTRRQRTYIRRNIVIRLCSYVLFNNTAVKLVLFWLQAGHSVLAFFIKFSVSNIYVTGICYVPTQNSS